MKVTELTELDNIYEQKKELEIYYYIDLTEKYDIEVLEKCLRVFLTVNMKEYKINKFINCSHIKVENSQQNDIIKRGLMTFNEMVNNSKLKTTNEVWMFYISNGNINELYENVFVILLNKEPMFKKSYYVINKLAIKVEKDLTKEKKLIGLKLFNKNLQELMSSEKIITYTNLEL